MRKEYKMSKYKTIIFDLDGTLLNTLEDLTDSTNYALAQFGMPVRSIEEVRTFVGNGIRKLIERAVPEGTTVEKTEQVFACFRSYYTDHCNCKTGLYPGVKELLFRLKEAGFLMAIVSNKAHPAVEALRELYFADVITVALGEREAEGIRKKPAPDMVELALQQLGSTGAEALYIGDSEVDRQTAANAGLDCLLVSWGFRERSLLETLGAAGIADDAEAVWKWITR